MSRNAALEPIFALETDIRNVRRWAGVLNHLGTTEHTVEADQVYVISNVLFEIGKRLEEHWQVAYETARGDR